MTLNIFISQVMNGKTDEEILIERTRLIDATKLYYQNEYIKVIDSFFSEYPKDDQKNKGVWYLGKSLMKLADADLCVFGPGTVNARGCQIELAVCNAYGIKTLYIGEDDDKNV